jgi:hypothetical protein
MYKVNFSHKLGLTCLLNSCTMYEVSFRHKLGPTYPICHTLMQEREGRENIDYCLWMIISLR